jgi:hypothetical protein
MTKVIVVAEANSGTDSERLELLKYVMKLKDPECVTSRLSAEVTHILLLAWRMRGLPRLSP